MLCHAIFIYYFISTYMILDYVLLRWWVDDCLFFSRKIQQLELYHKFQWLFFSFCSSLFFTILLLLLFLPISSPLLFIPHFDILSLFFYLFYLFSVAKIVPKADEIKDASAFLRMRTSEKRACLRASGALEVE